MFRSAIRAQAKLRIDYGDLNGQATTRVIWPIAIGFMNEARMLAAWCELREDFRHFRTDRIAAASEIGERYPGRRSQLVKAWRATMDEIAKR